MRLVVPMIVVALGVGALGSACAAPPPEREIAVAMVEYGFIPARIELRTGERVRFRVRNIGRMEHDFASDERGRALGLGHVHLRAGDAGDVDWTAPATGTDVRIICTLPGHEGLGMVGMLVVRERPPRSP